MKEIIKISPYEIGNAELNSANAREVYNYLEVKTKFADWINRAIRKYDFKENVDFVVILKNEKNLKGGRPERDYIVTLDMAKELAMLENNAKGKETRKYFIQAEKKLQTLTNGIDTKLLMQFIKQQQQTNEIIIKLLTTLVQQQEQRIETINKTQMQKLRSSMMVLASIIQECTPEVGDSEILKRLYREMNGRFGVNSYYDIAAADFEDVMELQGKAIKRWEEKRDQKAVKIEVEFKKEDDYFTGATK